MSLYQLSIEEQHADQRRISNLDEATIRRIMEHNLLTAAGRKRRAAHVRPVVPVKRPAKPRPERRLPVAVKQARADLRRLQRLAAVGAVELERLERLAAKQPLSATMTARKRRSPT